MKKIISLMLALMITLSLAACGGDSSSSSSGSSETTNGNAKSDGYAKFKKLEIGMTEEEVNKILGEPADVDKAYYHYKVTVNEKELELTVWINTVSGLVTNIYGHFSNSDYREEFMDSKVDLSSAKGLETGEIATYDACVSAFKTPGYLWSINEAGDKGYFWVNSSKGYVSVTAGPDGKIKTYNGLF